MSTPAFRELQSFSVLSSLVNTAPNLSEPKQLNPLRIKKYAVEALNLQLLYSTEQVNEMILSALEQLALERQLQEKMQAMQEGETLNYVNGGESETRPVLHTAMRDFFDLQMETPIAKNMAKSAYTECEKLKQFLLEIDKDERFTDLVQIGIGGSELGPHAIYEGLSAFQKTHRKVHFIANIDPDALSKVLNHLNLSKTLFIIVSKSGTTLETVVNEAAIRKRLERLGISAKNHLISVTTPRSLMDDPNKYLKVFFMWESIGGRFSATSMVGAIALGFSLGMDRLIDFLRGAHDMDRHARSAPPRQNLPMLSALLGVWNRSFLNHSTVAIIPYAHVLHRLVAHLQQLDMESNGKSCSQAGAMVQWNTGPIIWGEEGSNSQHSFFQYIHQGTTVVPVEFLGFTESQYQEDFMFQGTSSQEKLLSNMFAQAIALATGNVDSIANKTFSGNRPSKILLSSRLTPYTLGSLLSYYEHKVVFQGFIWGINSFDQEGVQLGKKLAHNIIGLFAQKRGESQPQEKHPLAESFIQFCK